MTMQGRIEAAGPERAVAAPRLWPLAWAMALTLGAMLFVGDAMATHFTPWPSIRGDAVWGRDFANVYTSGKLVLNGQLHLLYDISGYRHFQDHLFQGGLRNHNYSYPPPTLLYTWFFALLPYPVALLAWLTLTGAAFVAAARPYLRDAGLPAWVALLAPATWLNLWAGHYGLLIGALWLGAFHLLPRRPVVAGMLIGLMLVKPHLALLAPIILARRGEWKAVAAAAATALALTGLSILCFGADLWRTYLTVTAGVQAGMVTEVGTYFLTMMPTVMPNLSAFGLPHILGWAIQGLAAAAAIAGLMVFMPKDSRPAGLAGGVATFLVLPYAFNYDMTVAGLAALVMFAKQERARGDGTGITLMLAFLLPLLVRSFGYYCLPAAPLILAALLALILRSERARLVPRAA